MPEESSRLVMPLLLLLVLTAVVSTVHSLPLTSKRASDLESYEHLEPAVGTTSSPPASSAAVDIEPSVSTLPIAAAAASEESGGPVHVDLPLQPFGELPLPPGALQPPRRIVSYDQRQDGKYNIRADLENFMIVVIPSSPASGASLLDLLTRQNQQQKSTSANNKASAQQRKKEHGPHKKYHAGSAGTKAAIEDLPKPPSVNSKMNLVLLQEAVSAELARRQHSLSSQQQQQQQLQPDTFIEGRTPYRVDISSATAGAVQPISSVVSRLPYYARSAKSLRPGNVAALPSIDLGHNSVVLVGRLPLHKQRGFAWANTFVDKSDADRYDAAVLLRGSDDDDDNNNDDDNVALVEATLSGGAGDNGGSDSIDRLAAGDLPKSGPSNSGTAGGWDQLTLLGDGVEQCGPDRRRDSYGVCQFVPID